MIVDIDYQAGLDAIDELFATLPAESIMAFSVLSGSHSYGSARPESDVDMRGVYIVPIDDLVRIWDSPPRSLQHDTFDLTLWELGHFVKLAADANPNALELLWAPPIGFSFAGMLLRANRWRFLSKHVATTHIGYAEGQLRRAREGTGGSRGVKHLQREKFLFHTLRLVWQASRLLDDPDSFGLRLEEEEIERLWWWAKRPLDEVEDYFAKWRDGPLRVAAETTDLPDRVDRAAIDKLVLDIRHGDSADLAGTLAASPTEEATSGVRDDDGAG